MRGKVEVPVPFAVNASAVTVPPTESKEEDVVAIVTLPLVSIASR